MQHASRCIAVIALALALAGCSADLMRFNTRAPASSSSPPVASAAFCEVMAAQGGPVIWSKTDTRPTKERADKLNAVWKQCPQYLSTKTRVNALVAGRP